MLRIGRTILGAHVPSHQWCAVRGILAVKDEERAAFHGRLEELGRKKVLVVVIDCTIYMTAFILVLEATIDNHLLVKVLREFAVQ